MFTDYILNYKHYVGIGLIGISSLLYFKNKKLFVYVFGLTLILGTLNLIDIYYSNILFGIGPISFNPIFLILLIVFLRFNKELLNKMFPEKEINPEKEKEKIEKRIQHFENKFSNLSEFELKEIIDKNSPYVQEARYAADRILKNKNVL